MPEEKEYQIVFSPKTKKQLLVIPVKILKNILERIAELRNTPVPYFADSVKGSDNTYKFRVSVYRVVYFIQEDTITIYIKEVAHRKDAYDNY